MSDSYMIYDGNDTSYYGGFRTRTLADIFPKYEEFETEWLNSPYAAAVAPKTGSAETPVPLELVYYSLYARYGNSHISYSDEYQFTMYLFMTIFQYGPTWAKELEIQKTLRGLSPTDLKKGGKAIYNHAYNPGTAPSTSTLEELLAINDQNTTSYEKTTMEGYATLLALLENDVSEAFFDKFKKLFIRVAAPDYPLLYAEEN